MSSALSFLSSLVASYWNPTDDQKQEVVEVDFPALICNDKYFDISCGPLNLTNSQVEYLIDGYFRSYDTFCRNPIDVINLVKQYYGGAASFACCQSNHKPRLLLINKPFMIVDTREYDNNSSVFSWHQNDEPASLQIEQIILNSKDSINININSTKIDKEPVTSLHVKYKYLGSDCVKHSNTPSWSQIGLVWINRDKYLIPNETNKININTSNTSNVIVEMISKFYKSIQNNDFTKFNDLLYGNKRHNQIVLNGRWDNYIHTKTSLNDNDNSISDEQLFFKNTKINVNDTIEMNVIISDNQDAKAQFTLHRNQKDGNDHDSDDDHETRKWKLQWADTINRIPLVNEAIYFPAISIKGCNCKKQGGVLYQLSCQNYN